MTELTQAERKLFDALGEDWLIVLVERSAIIASKAYDMAAENAFIQDKRGPAVEALRRALKALRTDATGGKTFRCTPAFEALIAF